jgi:hypothetical protein
VEKEKFSKKASRIPRKRLSCEALDGSCWFSSFSPIAPLPDIPAKDGRSGGIPWTDEDGKGCRYVHPQFFKKMLRLVLEGIVYTDIYLRHTYAS